MPELPRHRLRHRATRIDVAGPSGEPEAAETLRMIHQTMQQAGAFTAVSGRGLIAIGGTALLTSAIAAGQPLDRWLALWLAEAMIAGMIAAFTIYRKAIATGTPLFSGPARKVAMGFVPAMTAGGALTVMLYRSGRPELIAPMWLLLYGVGVVAGGAWSVATVPVMGGTFMALSLPAFVFTGMQNVWMAVGFGALHVVFGVVVTRKYGG